MPFVKRKDGKYVSPTGQVLTLEQVRAYYARESEKAQEERKKKYKGK